MQRRGRPHRLSGPNRPAKFLLPEFARFVGRSDSRANNACEDGPKCSPQCSLSGGHGILLSIRKQSSTSSNATCNSLLQRRARWSHCVGSVFPRCCRAQHPPIALGRLLFWYLLETSSSSGLWTCRVHPLNTQQYKAPDHA